MRNSLLTILSVFLVFTLQAQKKSGHCQELSLLMEGGKYKDAYRHLVMNGEYSCGNFRFAQVLKSNGRYQEALEILQGQNTEAAKELRAELEGYLGMRQADELYTIRALNGNDTLSQTIFATLESPILLRKEIVETASFPRKLTEEQVILEQTGGDSTYFTRLKAEFQKRQQSYRFKLATGYLTPDTLLYYSAYYMVPLYSSGFHNDFAIYTWDGHKHELVKRTGKKGVFVHPTVTNDGWLIFSSDRDGGMGGMDLWKINLSAEAGEPINMGPDINSAYDEIYPASAGDSLYFVSNNPEKSLGGLDLLLAYGGKVTNPGSPLNSESDDFNPVTVRGDLAFMSTDRLYPDSLDLTFRVKPFKPRLLFDLIHGEVNTFGDMLGEKVELLDSEGNLLDFTYVNSEGRFTFVGIKGLENYTISFGEEKLSQGDKVMLFDKNFGLMEELEIDESGQVKFELLTPEDYVLEKVVNQDESMLSVDISGMFAGSDEERVQGVEIFLQDSDGKTIARAFTNEKGEFVFEQVKPDESYSFKSAVVDLDSEIRIFNQDGNVIESIKPGGEGEYVYVRLKESDKVITITNEERVKVRIAEDDRFKLDAIYFEFNDYSLVYDAMTVLNELITVLKNNPHVAIRLSGHTDSKGEAAYNLLLSQKRIESVKDYLKKNGIDSNRISGLGFGEKQLVNRCADGVECTEEEHAENRRIELQFYIP